MEKLAAKWPPTLVLSFAVCPPVCVHAATKPQAKTVTLCNEASCILIVVGCRDRFW